MRLTTIILITAILQVSASTFAQKITLSEKNAPLVKIFDKIRAQSGVDFLVSTSMLKDAKPVTIQVRNAELNEVLKKIFQSQNLEFAINDKSVVVSKKTPSFLDLPKPAFANVDARGRILDEKDSPLEGATVVLKGTNRTVKTDVKGEFVLANVPDDGVLVIRYVGYKQLEIALKDAVMPLDIKLNVTTGELEEVKITYNTGYQQLNKDRVTGSFAQPDKVMYENRIATDVISKLDGITSGLVFNRTGNGTASLRVRGQSTILAEANPLIVVDNFAYTDDIRNLNPADIESITILKDAAAASIWGARSGNGVIVITTKKGKFNQQLQIDLTVNSTVNPKPLLMKNKNFINSADYIDLETLLFDKGFYNANLANTTTRPIISPVVELLNKRKSGTITQEFLEDQLNKFKGIDSRKELLNDFYRTGLNRQYNVNVSSGSERMNYYLSLGHDNNNSNQIGINYKRYTLNSSAQFKPVKNLELRSNLNVNFQNSKNNIAATDLIRLNPYDRFTDENGNRRALARDFRLSWVDTVAKGRILDWHFIPLDERDNADLTLNLNNTRIDLGANYHFLKNLSIDIAYRYEKSNTVDRKHYSINTYLARNLINKYSTVTAVSMVNNLPKGGILDMVNSEAKGQNFRTQLNFNNDWNLHHVDAIAGVDISEDNSTSQRTYNYGYNDEFGTIQTPNYFTTYPFFPPGSGSAAIPNLNSQIVGTINRYRAYFANAAYTFSNLYSFSVSGRIDQANIFGVKANQRSTPLWSAGVKWNLSNEKFYSLKWLPVLDLRATFGYNGNRYNRTTAYATGFLSNSTGPLQPAYASISTAGNPQLYWEKIKTLNIAVNYSFSAFASGSIEYYLKRGVDLIGNTPLPTSTGFVSSATNYANMKGEGIDVRLNTLNIDRRIKWSSAILFSISKDKVTKYDPESNAVIMGNPVQSIYSLKWAGLDPLTGDPLGYLNGEISKNYSQINSTQTLIKNQVFTGAANPTVFGGLRNSITYQNFTMSANISFKFGYFFRKPSIHYSNLFINGTMHEDYLKRWKQAGDETKTNVPSLVYPAVAARETFYNSSEATALKGDHIRFQDISLGYDLNRSNWENNPFKQIRINAYVNNIGLLWTANKENIDPDFFTTIPLQRTYSLGISAKF